MIEHTEPPAEPVAPEPAPLYFWEQKCYMGSDGRMIIERIPLDGFEIPEDFKTFKGMRSFQKRMPNGQVATIDLDFAIPGQTIYDAIENYAEAFAQTKTKATADIDQKITDARKPKVMPVSAIPRNLRFPGDNGNGRRGR